MTELMRKTKPTAWAGEFFKERGWSSDSLKTVSWFRAMRRSRFRWGLALNLGHFVYFSSFPMTDSCCAGDRFILKVLSVSEFARHNPCVVIPLLIDQWLKSCASRHRHSDEGGSCPGKDEQKEQFLVGLLCDNVNASSAVLTDVIAVSW